MLNQQIHQQKKNADAKNYNTLSMILLFLATSRGVF